MDHVGTHQSNGRVAMFGVIPGEKLPAESPGILCIAESLRKLWPIIEGLELGFRKGVVVRGMRSAMGLGYAQISQKLGHAVGSHGASSIGVDCQLALHNGLLFTGFCDQTSGQCSRLPMGHHPAHHKTTEDIQDHIEIEVNPLGRSLEFGDVPGQDLIGPGGQQLRFVVSRMAQLISSLPNLCLLGKDPIHSAYRAQIPAFIQKHGIDLPRGKPRLV